MKAMVLRKLWNLKENKSPLELFELPIPVPGENDILVKVSACGVCHTELDEIEGRTPPSKFPIILGHQIIGRVAKVGGKVNKFMIGDRVGIAWIHSACGKCTFCREGRENLCDEFKATGRDADGGYAEYTTVSENFAYKIPEIFSDSEAAPLLCAGAIGYRSLKLAMVEDGKNIGLTGFGASAHLVIKMIKHLYPHSRVFVFSRTEKEREFAKELGAFWAGNIEDKSPEKLHCII
ncbi:MAG: alcohol dehydrogenase catalytic domain-containing protein, partial [Nitrospirota bacterium]|nr:alcohol dehydrogenase catalytic domain-containing protein [Nitrospirota bacterium]